MPLLGCVSYSISNCSESFCETFLSGGEVNFIDGFSRGELPSKLLLVLVAFLIVGDCGPDFFWAGYLPPAYTFVYS